MENKLPPISKELKDKLNQEGEALARQWHYYPFSDEFRDIVGAYEAGGAAYAHYKERFEQAMNALEQIANAPTPYNLEEMWSWIHTARNLSNTALASWKEEGKEVGNE